MKVASITLPTHDNDGRRVAFVHEKIERALLAGFGGFTAVRGTGGWKANETGRVYHDDVVVYTTAMDPTPGNRYCLQQLAAMAAIDAKQEAVYVVHADGTVEFVTAAQAILNDEKIYRRGNAITEEIEI